MKIEDQVVIEPIVIIKWAKDRGFSVPKDVEARVRENNQAAVDWKSKYEELEQRYLNLQNELEADIDNNNSVENINPRVKGGKNKNKVEKLFFIEVVSKLLADKFTDIRQEIPFKIFNTYNKTNLSGMSQLEGEKTLRGWLDSYLKNQQLYFMDVE